ncbi:predicted protein [Histoplasma mississippiense (nom. inval.)]|uniref:predicted protein n=1 Tax=Ajellomyces capsulatus (strain NAm1 / WU24) TaxID=2059318 RepID=UPI000157C910|nr:predicted protein [Histoplasma mississippiense (nom. inval.)]EDN09651.1 predicted protein [Histoplasma mississippiense (nom. inval.)]
MRDVEAVHHVTIFNEDTLAIGRVQTYQIHFEPNQLLLRLSELDDVRILPQITEYQSCKASTPLSGAQLLRSQGTASPEDTHYFQRRIGSCIYAAVMTRLDIAFVVGKLATFIVSPSERHSAEIDRVIAYLRNTKNLAIQYGGADTDALSMNIVEVASGASFADDSDRRSTESDTFKLFGGAVDWKVWKSKRPQTKALLRWWKLSSPVAFLISNAFF